jgi:hypothetical protein
MKWLCVALLTSLSIASAQAYTCEDVRSLSHEQRAYYIRVYNITTAQQERIRRACFGSRVRRASLSEEGRPSHFGRRVWDASEVQ